MINCVWNVIPDDVGVSGSQMFLHIYPWNRECNNFVQAGV